MVTRIVSVRKDSACQAKYKIKHDKRALKLHLHDMRRPNIAQKTHDTLSHPCANVAGDGLTGGGRRQNGTQKAAFRNVKGRLSQHA